MQPWDKVHDAIKAIQNRARTDFMVEVTDDVLSEAARLTVDARLSDFLTAQFQTLSTRELLTAQEILNTDKTILEKANRQRTDSGKKKGDLN